MNTKLHNAADQFFGVLNGNIVCHWSVIQFPMRKGWKRGHRLVVLPDYQGIGIGSLFHNYCADIVKEEGYNVNSTTTTPALIHSMVKDNKWRLVRKGRATSVYSDFLKYGKGVTKMTNVETAASSRNRITFSFNYK